jgi:thiamine kinase-like enzyme
VLESTLSGVDQTVGFCHNDLQYGNIMIYEETRQVTLIVSILFLEIKRQVDLIHDLIMPSWHSGA